MLEALALAQHNGGNTQAGARLKGNCYSCGPKVVPSDRRTRRRPN